MRRVLFCRWMLLLVLGAAVESLHAQQSSEEATTDGGGSPDVLESIFVPALPGAPFTLTLATEWTRLMENGGTFVSVNQRVLRRDSVGRLYQERWLLVPKGSGIVSSMSWIQIADPTAKTLLQCSVRQQACELLRWNMPSAARYLPPAAGAQPLRNGAGIRMHEDLGESDVLGLPVHVYRDTTTLNPGTFGNDKPLVTTREFSFSAALGVNLRSVLDTPQVGRQQFTVTAITTSEPEPQFFQVPAGYRVVDHRGTPATP